MSREVKGIIVSRLMVLISIIVVPIGIFLIFSKIKKVVISDIMYIITDISMFSKEVKNSNIDIKIHIVNDPVNARVMDLLTSIVNINKKTRFIPISAGTTESPSMYFPSGFSAV